MILKNATPCSTNVVGIFLHMGPGYNAQMEKKILQAQCPNILFWDQPKISNSRDAFKYLVQECQNQVLNLYKHNNNKPIHIMAHSFGGHLAHQLILQNPNLISSCELYNAGYDLPSGFLKLLSIIKNSPSTDNNLKIEISNFIKQKKIPTAQKEEIWSYLSLISKEPLFFKFYWQCSNLFKQYATLSGQFEPMDMLSFQNILNDFLATEFTPESPKKCNWNGSVNLYMGENDPLINVDAESKIWSHIFPQIKCHTLKTSGHFSHLEALLV